MPSSHQKRPSMTLLQPGGTQQRRMRSASVDHSSSTHSLLPARWREALGSTHSRCRASLKGGLCETIASVGPCNAGTTAGVTLSTRPWTSFKLLPNWSKLGCHFLDVSKSFWSLFKSFFLKNLGFSRTGIVFIPLKLHKSAYLSSRLVTPCNRL